jgi:hypothetical protein
MVVHQSARFAARLNLHAHPMCSGAHRSQQAQAVRINAPRFAFWTAFAGQLIPDPRDELWQTPNPARWI